MEKSDANKRMCYCDALRKKDPDYLKKQGIPDGFCGTCEKCGKPGHIRHHPGSVPYTGAWCDRCYRILTWTHPLAFPGLLVWTGAAIGIIFAIKEILK